LIKNLKTARMIYTSTHRFARISLLFFLVAFLFLSQIANAQAPGGIATNLKLWLKANSSVTPSIQGSAITSWNDQSSGGNNAVYSTPMLSQTILNPTYQQNALNFNPTVRFAGTSTTNLSAIGGNLSPALTSNNISAYTVFLMNAISPGSSRVLMISQTPTTSDWQNQEGVDLLSRNGNNVYGSRNNSAGPIVGPGIGTPLIYSTHLTASSQWRSEINGNAFTTNVYPSAAFNSAYYRLGLSTYSSDDYLNGDIAEVILYNTDQSSLASHNQIESYLAIKYGIHKIGNYVNSSNAVIWDATANILYDNDVFGIGHDDASGLLQSQSNSTNTGSGDGTGQSGKGNIIISNPSSLVNNGFLVIGHNTGALTEANAIVGANTTKRVQRIWKAQSTGNPGNVTLSFDKTGLTYSGQIASDYVLLVDPTGLGNFDGGSVVKYTAASLTGNKLIFNAVALPTGAVFTFQTLGPPNVQATNIVFSGTTGTSTTASWTNGNGSSRAVFMYAGASGSALPVDLTSYTANTVFGSGTQIGATGWYCVYNGTGTTVNVTGLLPATTYQVMTIEYDGLVGSQIYLSTVSTGNPAGVTTLSNVATLSNLTISQGTLTPIFATGTINYTASVSNAVASITVTPTTTDSNATVTVNGIAVTSGSPSGAIALAVGPNIITTVVTAQDGTTLGTYTTTVTKSEAPPIVTNFSPQTGPVGTTVTISGSNFGATIAENIVFFGATRATVTAASMTSLTVTVPVGAS
jgi:hypothetical protein